MQLGKCSGLGAVEAVEQKQKVNKFLQLQKKKFKTQEICEFVSSPTLEIQNGNKN